VNQHSEHKNSAAIDLSEFRVGWRFIILALFGVATSAAVVPLYGFGAMVMPLEQAFGWQRSDLMATATFIYVGAIFSSQLAGVLNRRYGIRPVAIGSLMGLPLIFLLMSRLDLFGHSIWLLYALFFLVTFAGVGTLQVTWTQLINLWFEKNRGLALAIILSGSGFTGLLLPSLITAAVTEWGWRAGFVAMAALPLLLTLPLALWWLSSTERPTVIARSAAPASTALPGMMFAQAVRSWRYWVINISMVLVSAAVVVMVINTVPMLRDKGYSAAEASRIFGALGGSLVVGRVMVGYLVDRLWAPGVAFVALAMPGFGCLLLVTMSGNPSLVVMGVAMVGIGAGAEFDLAAFLVARYFGMRDYARLFGLQMAVISAGVGVTPTLSALLYRFFGNYDFVLMLNTAMFLVGAAILLTLGRYPRFSVDPH
jgi:MFS family permease